MSLSFFKKHTTNSLSDIKYMFTFPQFSHNFFVFDIALSLYLLYLHAEPRLVCQPESSR